MKEILEAAYAAQFQSEDYAGLVKELRERAGSYDSHDYHEEIELKAADAIEALLAEREVWKGRQKATAALLKRVEDERDALAARLDLGSEEQSMTKLRIGPFLKKVRQEKQMTLRAVEEAADKEISNAYLSQLESGKIANPSPHVLYTLSLVFGVAYETLMERAGYVMPAPNRLAPVEDEELVEIAVKEVEKVIASANDSDTVGGARWKALRAAIAAIRPHIEAAEREKWQKMLARMGAGTTKTGAVNE